MAETRQILFAPGYFVSDDGRVFSEKFGERRELKPWRSGACGHLRVCLRIHGATRKEYVHRLVALVFHGPPPGPAYEVRHLDGNPSNNAVGNLRWGTHGENMADVPRHGTHVSVRRPDRVPRGERHGSHTKPWRVARGERVGIAKLTEPQVVAIRATFAETGNISETARRVGVPRGAASGVIHGRTWAHVQHHEARDHQQQNGVDHG